MESKVNRLEPVLACCVGTASVHTKIMLGESKPDILWLSTEVEATGHFVSILPSSHQQ